MSVWLIVWLSLTGVSVLLFLAAWWMNSQINSHESVGAGLLLGLTLFLGGSIGMLGLLGLAGYSIILAFG